MKSLLSLALILFTGLSAHANNITVEFTPCSYNTGNICALVMRDNTLGKNYDQQEMGVDTQNADAAYKIAAAVEAMPHKRTFAMSVEGKINKIYNLLGKFTAYQLKIERLIEADATGSSPRAIREKDMPRSSTR